jgi:acetolactate synthase regulatory subunit
MATYRITIVVTDVPRIILCIMSIIIARGFPIAVIAIRFYAHVILARQGRLFLVDTVDWMIFAGNHWRLLCRVR